jgi:site-specific recombinase
MNVYEVLHVYVNKIVKLQFLLYVLISHEPLEVADLSYTFQSLGIMKATMWYRLLLCVHVG